MNLSVFIKKERERRNQGCRVLKRGGQTIEQQQQINTVHTAHIKQSK